VKHSQVKRLVLLGGEFPFEQLAIAEAVGNGKLDGDGLLQGWRRDRCAGHFSVQFSGGDLCRWLL
jgi:hypothetical protein